MVGIGHCMSELRVKVQVPITVSTARNEIFSLADMASLRTAARKLSQKSPNDVVILAAVRSPVTRAFKGGFKDAWPEDILGPVSAASKNSTRSS